MFLRFLSCYIYSYDFLLLTVMEYYSIYLYFMNSFPLGEYLSCFHFFVAMNNSKLDGRAFFLGTYTRVFLKCIKEVVFLDL